MCALSVPGGGVIYWAPLCQRGGVPVCVGGLWGTRPVSGGRVSSGVTSAGNSLKEYRLCSGGLWASVGAGSLLYRGLRDGSPLSP